MLSIDVSGEGMVLIYKYTYIHTQLIYMYVCMYVRTCVHPIRPKWIHVDAMQS